MLTGLIFATEDAEDRSDTLAATLPFGGMTLLEYQARLLIAAGARHILVAVGRVTPSLLGAVSRDVLLDLHKHRPHAVVARLGHRKVVVRHHLLKLRRPHRPHRVHLVLAPVRVGRVEVGPDVRTLDRCAPLLQ